MLAKDLGPHSILRLLTLCVLLSGVFVVLRPFLVALSWAAVLVVFFWPANIYLRHRFSNWKETLAATCMTVLLVSLLLGIVIPFLFALTVEMKSLVVLIRESAFNGNSSIHAFTSEMPWLGKYISPFFAESANDLQEALLLLEEYQSQMFSVISSAARGVWGVLFSLGVTIFTSYFFFRYGDVLARQLLIVSEHLGGKRYVNLIDSVYKSVQGVTYGVAGAAICQGVLAGFGYYIFGAPLPLLMGALTIILGLIPFGPPLLYLPVSVFMLLSGFSWLNVAGLALWGIAVVSTVDNVFRPLFIYHTTKLPILLAFFGGIGGILAFGMVGLFIGPVILALAQTIWLSSVTSGVRKDLENTACAETNASKLHS